MPQLTKKMIIAVAVTGVFLACFISCGKHNDTTALAALPQISTSHDLDSVSLKAAGLMLVLDFSADWCRPCGILAPMIEAIAEEYKGKALFYRINIDKSQELAASFGVRGIPYVVFMKNGKPVYALTGLNPAENYRKVLDLCGGRGNADDCIKTLNEKL